MPKFHCCPSKHLCLSEKGGVVPDFTTKTGRVVKTCSLCRADHNKSRDLIKMAKRNAITAANLKQLKLAAEVGKSDLTEEQTNAQIEEYTDDGISNVQAHVDVHPNHLFYINGAVSCRFLIE